MSKRTEQEEIRLAPEEIPETAFFVTADELFLLLYSWKIGTLPLPEGILERIPGEEECANAAIRLVRKGVLSPDDENHLVLDDGVREFLNTVKEHEYVVFERGSSYEVIPRCLYVHGETVAELRPDQVRKNSFGIRCLPLKELAEETSCYGFFPEGDKEPESLRESKEEWLPPEEMSADKLLEDERILLLTETFLRDSAVPEKKHMILQNVGTLLLVTDAKGTRNTAEFVKEDLFSTVYQP